MAGVGDTLERKNSLSLPPTGPSAGRGGGKMGSRKLGKYGNMRAKFDTPKVSKNFKEPHLTFLKVAQGIRNLLNSHYLVC